MKTLTEQEKTIQMEVVWRLEQFGVNTSSIGRVMGLPHYTVSRIISKRKDKKTLGKLILP